MKPLDTHPPRDGVIPLVIGCVSLAIMIALGASFVSDLVFDIFGIR